MCSTVVPEGSRVRRTCYQCEKAGGNKGHGTSVPGEEDCTTRDVSHESVAAGSVLVLYIIL